MRVTEFDVLITLGNAEQHRLRMTDLATAVMLSSGGLTRLIGRLEDRGLVRRDPDPSDARGSLAELTEAGAVALAQARVTHNEVIERLLGSKLEPRELAAVAAVLGRVVED